MLRLSEKGDYDKLAELWDLGFPGEPEFGRFILNRFPDTDNILVHEEDGGLLAMLIMLPRVLFHQGKRLSASYIMGVTTRPEARGRGVMRELMDRAHEILSGRGFDLAVLIPAEKSLFDYYARFGYIPFFEIERSTVSALPLDSSYLVETSPKNTEAFDKIFRAALGQAAYIERSADDWRCAMDEHLNFGGQVLLLYSNDLPVSYAYYGVENGKVRINEALGLNFKHEAAACAAVFAQTGAETAELMSPAKSDGQPFGAALALSDKGRDLLKTPQNMPPYINLIHN